jgi:ferredoxin
MNDGQSPNNTSNDPVMGVVTAADPAMPTQPQTSQQPPAASQPPVVMQSKMIGKYLVEVINEKCIGAASCVAIAPNVFQLNEENIAYVISQDGNDDDTKLLAAQSCPTAAIIVTDVTTGQQVWPRLDV